MLVNNDKSVVLGVFSLLTGVDNCLPTSICHYTQHDISNTAIASYDSPNKSHCHHFQVSNSKGKSDVDLLADFENNIGPPCCTSVSLSSPLGRHIRNCWPFEFLVNKCEDPATLFLRTHP